jgi:ABC-2 type transport system ATP-binding protein
VTEPVAVKVEGLVKRYGPVVAVDGLSFSIPAGRTTALLGSNGAGKTTTIAMLLGLLAPSAGRIEIFGLPMPKARNKLLPRMNFSSPYVDLPLRLTVRQNLRVYADLYGIPRTGQRITELVERLDLGDFIDRPTGRLSAGQKTRVVLAKALINQPDLLLLDEPTASLDPDTADRLRSMLADYQAERGAAVLLASHNMNEVERLAHHVVMLKAGRLVAEGSPGELLEQFGREDMEEVFLDIARGRSRTMEEA